MDKDTDHTRMLVTITVDELREIVSQEVERALAGTPVASSVELLNTQEMAGQIGVSDSTLRAYVQQGCPYIQAGKGFRFRPAAVFEWLETRNA